MMNRTEEILSTANKLRWEVGENFHDSILESIYKDASEIAGKVVTRVGEKPKFDLDRFIDRIVTGKWTGFPIMFLLLALVFWLTIIGSNIPSGWISFILVDTIHPFLKNFLNLIQKILATCNCLKKI